MVTKASSKSSESYSIRVPKLSLKNTSYLPVLMVLLLIASFFLGRLSSQVEYLKKGATIGTAVGQAVPQAAPPRAAPTLAVDKVKPISDSDHIRGNKDAKVAIIEYSDLECPFCKTFHPNVNDILKTYPDKVKLVYRHYPLSFHANAQKEAEASECVAELGGNDSFWNFIDKLFERTTSNGTGFALDKLGPLAAEVGVNQQSFQSCLDTGKYTKKVQDQFAEGSAAGVTGTPTSFIIDRDGKGEAIVGAQPKESITAAIDKLLK